MFRFLLFLILGLFFSPKPKPTVFLIGDSTIKTGQGKGESDMWGWGSVLDAKFDTTKINIENHAIGGRSSRTFLTDGRWEPLLAKFQKGDYLFIQFGHNDDWAINDTLRARGTIKGIGEESVEIDNVVTKKHEVVHTFGWYIRKFATEAQAKGVEVFICSPVPRNNFEGSKIKRTLEYYPKWAAEVANQTRSQFIDLHERSAVVYESLGTEKVKELYFTPKDNTHTNLAGAKLNAENVVLGIKNTDKTTLKRYLLK